VVTNAQAEQASRAEAGLAVAKRVFADIRSRFPDLEMIDDTAEVAAAGIGVSLSMTIPVQAELSYKVNLNLQNTDELHFEVSNFWGEWFPCTYPECARIYADAVCGFLSGDHRVIEYYLFDKHVKSKLQIRQNNRWRTIYMSTYIPGLILWIMPWKWSDYIVVRNSAVSGHRGPAAGCPSYPGRRGSIRIMRWPPSRGSRSRRR
jgi:hypothetical protein